MFESRRKADAIAAADACSMNRLAIADTDNSERPIGRYDFEDGSYVRIVARGKIDTEEALEMVETLIDLKRKELARRKAQERQEKHGDEWH